MCHRRTHNVVEKVIRMLVRMLLVLIYASCHNKLETRNYLPEVYTCAVQYILDARASIAKLTLI